MYNQILTLIQTDRRESNLGVLIDKPAQRRNVFCSISSVRATENFAGVQAGFKPVLRAKLADRIDYQGESMCEYDGVGYEIYRTYYTGDQHGIELYLQRRAGKNGV